MLYLAGDGNEADRSRLERLIVELGLSGRVTLLGQIHDPERWLAASDLFVQPSREEAFGLVYAEAAASGIPVVATRVGGIPEIVLDGESGLLVESEDAGALATAIVELLSDPARRERMGESARRRAELHFSIEKMAKSYAELMRGLAVGTRSRGKAIS
jgi:glycosyltransferase involved in cell wall biosynthesis